MQSQRPMSLTDVVIARLAWYILLAVRAFTPFVSFVLMWLVSIYTVD